MIIWIYGSISVLIISLVGLVIIALVPLIQHNHQSNISQIFVGLAIGTLSSDALLHLLPHAFSSYSDHQHGNETIDEHPEFHSEKHSHSHNSIWFGLMTLLGIIGFLIFERVITILTDLVNRPNDTPEQRKKSECPPNTELVVPELELLNHNHNHGHEMKEFANGAKKHLQDSVQVHDECHRSTISFPKPDGEGYIHLTSHHHHHKVNQGPSAAVMVLAGDIVHNLFDGLAIGVAFSGSGIGGGLSTSIAVLFHELPHELGDFTIIIRSGMSIRNAIYWNIIASIICWVGMALGIVLGSIQDAWLSSLVAGTFLYISLVDMVPELDSCPHLPSRRRAVKLTVQIIGITIGVAIMLVISLYEDALLSLF